MISKTKKEQRQRRQARIRTKVSGTSKRPRFSVFKSNKSIFAQLIDDEKGVTLVSGTTLKSSKGTPTDKATGLGVKIAKDAKAKKIGEVVFDRGGYTFTGQVKALADAARKEGLIF